MLVSTTRRAGRIALAQGMQGIITGQAEAECAWA